MSKTYLKIKIKSLAAEAVIIKQEERKWLKAPFSVENEKFTHPMYFSLLHHRLEMVRKECRYSHIAYGFLRGLAYKQIEAKCYEPVIMGRLIPLIMKFGPKGSVHAYTKEQRAELDEQVASWLKVPALPKEEAAE